MEDSDRLSALRSQLFERLGSERYQLWFGPHTDLQCCGGALRVGCPSQFELEWMRRKLHTTLLAMGRQLWGSSFEVRYSMADDNAIVSPVEQEVLAPIPKEPVSAKPTQPPNGVQPRRRVPAERSTFANFVVGAGNEIAVRTAQSVVERPGHYGPLLLFGPTGTGKSHLTYAMLQAFRQKKERCRTVRLTAEQFTSEFLEALESRTLPSFRHKYRSIDVLVVEDVQFLAGKPATLDELLHRIDTLHEQGRQVVLTCDRSPGQLQKVSGELVSRISGGLAIPVESPDYATRLGIVKQMAGRLHVELNDKIVQIIASQVAGSARQLSGALNRLVAASRAQALPITEELTRSTMQEFTQQNAPAVRLADIQRAVCQVFGVEASTLKSARKTRSVADPRMLAMWLARKHTRAALGEIGEYFGRRSHSTVISAQKKIEHLVSTSGQLALGDQGCQVEEAIRQVEHALRTA